MGCEPRFAAKQNELSSRVGFSQVPFNRLTVLDGQTPDDFRNAAALTGFGQIKRPLNGRPPRH